VIDLNPGYVLIIPRDAEDQHALTQALYAAARDGEGVGLTTATRTLAFIVPQSLADRVGRGASPEPPPEPDTPDAPDSTDAPDGSDSAPDATGETPPVETEAVVQAPDEDSQDGPDDADSPDGDSDGSDAKAPGSTRRSSRSRKTAQATPADPAAGETQEG
jgi:hypothetical protein